MKVMRKSVPGGFIVFTHYLGAQSILDVMRIVQIPKLEELWLSLNNLLFFVY